jgi:hypothetical protein
MATQHEVISKIIDLIGDNQKQVFDLKRNQRKIVDIVKIVDAKFESYDKKIKEFEDAIKDLQETVAEILLTETEPKK